MKLTLPLVLVALAIAVAPAIAGGARAELALPFKATATSTATGLKMDLRYADADDPKAKPPTIEQLKLHLPEGTRLDPSAVPYCEASDEEIQMRGRDACPRESLVGTGKLEVWLGAPGDPQKTDLALFNARGQIIEVLLFEGTNTTAALEHLFIEGSTIRANTAQVPDGAPPERRFAASHIVWDVPVNGGYLITPASCPADGLWRTRGEFKFADGSTATANNVQKCDGAGDRSARSMSVELSPRAIVRGKRRRIRVRVEAEDRACIRGATVRIGRHRAVTDSAGRATLAVRVLKRRRVVVRVTSPRCGSARATLVTRAR